FHFGVIFRRHGNRDRGCAGGNGGGSSHLLVIRPVLRRAAQRVVHCQGTGSVARAADSERARVGSLFGGVGVAGHHRHGWFLGRRLAVVHNENGRAARRAYALGRTRANGENHHLVAFLFGVIVRRKGNRNRACAGDERGGRPHL